MSTALTPPPAPAPEPADNRLFVLILQHPQERRETLSTAAATRAALRHTDLAVGLSWPNLTRLAGRGADPRRWGVAYLGSARPPAGAGEIVDATDGATDRAALYGLDGIVLLDGSWSEAKTLWWRNPWLLKLRRLVLNPAAPSRYGTLRREPRREAMATIEAAALLLRHAGEAGAAASLDAALDRVLAANTALIPATGSPRRAAPRRRRRH